MLSDHDNLNFSIMVGGAPLTQKFVDDIGADAYGANAAVASDLAKALIS